MRACIIAAIAASSLAFQILPAARRPACASSSSISRQIICQEEEEAPPDANEDGYEPPNIFDEVTDESIDVDEEYEAPTIDFGAAEEIIGAAEDMIEEVEAAVPIWPRLVVRIRANCRLHLRPLGSRCDNSLRCKKAK